MAPTLGPQVCAFIERYIVHGPGDYIGQPFVLTPWEKAIVYRAYELEATGERRWNEVVLGMPKGNAKSELGAAIAIAEAAGPVIFSGWREDGRPMGQPRQSPEIPVAAASFDQADIVFGAVREMIRKGPLAEHFDVYDVEAFLKDRPGRLFRVAAVAGTNDGGRPTFAVEDEVHEWVGNKARVDLVLGQNLRKRANTWRLRISTAGFDLQSLLGQLYELGKRIAAGEAAANGYLMIWFEAPGHLDLADPKQFEEACRLANPAMGDFLPYAGLVHDFQHTPEYEFRRYHLNQWTSAPSRWLPMGAWESRAGADITVEEQTPIVLALEGEWDGRSTALIGCTLERPRHLFVVARWEREDGAPATWQPPRQETIKAAIQGACERYQVQSIALNPTRWPEMHADLEALDLPVVEWPTHSVARIAPACKQLFDAIVVEDQALTHSGDVALARQLGAATVKEDAHGRAWIAKAPAAVAAVLAYDMAVRGAASTSVYDTRGLLEL